MVTKIYCLSCLDIWRNLLDISRKRQAVMNMKVDINKVICSDFDREFLYDYRYEHDDLPLFDQSMNLHTFQLQELPCLSLVLLHLEFVIHLIKSACTSLLFTKLDPILCKDFKGISDICVIIEAIICEE